MKDDLGFINQRRHNVLDQMHDYQNILMNARQPQNAKCSLKQINIEFYAALKNSTVT